jgi:hypothetical protein
VLHSPPRGPALVSSLARTHARTRAAHASTHAGPLREPPHHPLLTLELRQFLSTRPALCRTPTSFASLASSVAMTDISIGCAQAGRRWRGQVGARGGQVAGVRTRLLTLACSICCSAAARVFWSGDMQFISSGVTSMVPTSRGLTNTRESPATCRTASVSVAQIIQVGAWLSLSSSAQWDRRTGSTRRALACTLMPTCDPTPPCAPTRLSLRLMPSLAPCKAL